MTKDDTPLHGVHYKGSNVSTAGVIASRIYVHCCLDTYACCVNTWPQDMCSADDHHVALMQPNPPASRQGNVPSGCRY
jgi:hypothetical protein